jgi:hypothetical protein
MRIVVGELGKSGALKMIQFSDSFYMCQEMMPQWHSEISDCVLSPQAYLHLKIFIKDQQATPPHAWISV